MRFLKPIIIATLVFLSACATPHYVHDYKTSRALDFRTGTWLVNNIETNLPWKAKEYLTKDFLKRLKSIGGDSIVYIDSARINFSLPNKIAFEPSNEIIDLLKLTTDFDYLINVKTQENRDDFGDILLAAPHTYGKSEAEVEIVIYEIKSGTLIYSQRIIASVELDETDSDVRLAKSSANLIFAALKKGMKEMKKHAIR